MTGVDRARQALGARLKEIRKDAGLNGRQLSAAAEWHWSKISRIENGQRTPSPADIELWCSICDAGLAVPDLIAALRNVEAQWGEWKRMTAAGHAQRQRRGVDLDARARRVRSYGGVILPGLLQTEPYARAALSTCIEFLGTHDDLDAAVEARLQRQKALTEGSTSFTILVHESVLHMTVGGPRIMHDQLWHLLEVGVGNPRLIFGIVPLGYQFVYTTTGFIIYDERMALVDTISAELTVTAPTELVLYEQAWAGLVEQAVYGDAAKAAIRAAQQNQRCD